MPKAAVKSCFHCGEDIEYEIVFNEKSFCCEGCKTVYEVLSENNLDDYYALNSAPGKKQKEIQQQSRFAYLDDGDVKQRLISFNDGHISTVTFYIPQIHCTSCIYLLENLYRIKKGVKRTVVNFIKREAAITYDNRELSLRQVVETLTSLGYEPHINLDDLERKEKSHHLRRYYVRIAISFFAFGNIMLLSFPEYLGLDVLAESPFRKFFGYLNFLIALPVMFYCAQEFFESAWNALKQKTINMDIPIVLGVIAMFIRSSYEIFSHTGAGYFDTLASLILLMLIGRLFQNKTYDLLSFERDYKSYFPVAVTVVNNGSETTIPLTKLRTGDHLLIRNMELIPTDGILVNGSGNIDYSFVTGEAVPVAKTKGDTIYAGGKQIGSAIEVQVTKNVSHSYLTQLWNDAAFNKGNARNITSLATSVSYWFTPVVMAIAALAFLFWSSSDMHRALNALTSVLIITCPCALALSSPFTLGNVLRILSAKGIYLKNATTVEKIATINTLVFDKTGTLTNTETSRIEFHGDTLTEHEKQLVKAMVYHSSHPLSKKVYQFLKTTPLITTEHFKEIEGSGVEGWVDENCVRIGSKRYLYGETTDAKQETSFNHASKVYVGINGKVRGFYLVKNEYRKGLPEVLRSLLKKFSLYVVSGDNDTEKNYLKQYIPESNLVFHQQPMDKLNKIKALQEEQRKVMMIGDGLNDAGALRQADVGLVISDDVNNFSPACDGIMEAARFTLLESLLNYSRAGVQIIKASFIISLLYNVVGIYFAVQGTMTPLVAAVIMPLSSATVILFTTLATKWAARRHGF